MNDVFPNMRAVLVEIRRLLTASGEGCWSGTSVAELIMDVDILVGELDDGRILDVKRLHGLTLPTCPLQEVAISNGWGDKYLSLIADLEKGLAGR